MSGSSAWMILPRILPGSTRDSGSSVFAKVGDRVHLHAEVLGLELVGPVVATPAVIGVLDVGDRAVLLG
ncbi:hypothetical protein [Dactylosporangium sp. CA-233914]|uniref:hypothetical protein n=1 Tax=Dactylosporangium sp. CA-233914 TaxID=3239934 RepID=UPI003D8E70BD